MLVHYGAPNVSKRETHKQEKIKKMQNLLLELQGKLEKAIVLSLEKNSNVEESKNKLLYKKRFYS